MTACLSFLRLSTTVAALAVAAGSVPALAADETKPVASCTAPSDLTVLDHPLTRIARKIAAGEAVTIVAVGSSSTAGAGASSPAMNYPSRLQVELSERFPRIPFKV